MPVAVDAEERLLKQVLALLEVAEEAVDVVRQRVVVAADEDVDASTVPIWNWDIRSSSFICDRTPWFFEAGVTVRAAALANVCFFSVGM